MLSGRESNGDNEIVMKIPCIACLKEISWFKKVVIEIFETVYGI